MTPSTHSSPIGPTRCGAVSGHDRAETGHIQQTIINLVRGFWPVKTWAALADVFGLSESAAKKRLAGTRDFSAEELVALLRSEHGATVLAELMADAPPTWWRTISTLLEAHDARRVSHIAARRAARLLQDTIDADQSVRDAIGRAETALAVSSSDHPRALAARTRAAMGLQARPVAQRRG